MKTFTQYYLQTIANSFPPHTLSLLISLRLFLPAAASQYALLPRELYPEQVVLVKKPKEKTTHRSLDFAGHSGLISEAKQKSANRKTLLWSCESSASLFDK